MCAFSISNINHVKKDDIFKKLSNGETIYGREQLGVVQPFALEAERLCREFNALPGDSPLRKDILIHLLKKPVPDSVIIKSPFICDYGFNITLEEKVFISYGAVFLDLCPIYIGEETLIGPGVHLYAASHPTDMEGRKRAGCFGKPITIGKNVWIGGGSIVLPGVTIGDNSVVGAGSVVTKDVPPMVVVGGNPAKIIRHL